MASWIDTPLIVLVAVAVLTILYRFARWQGTVDTDLTSIKGFMAEIRGDIKNIFHKLPPPIATAHSPMELTEYGETLASQLHAKEWAKQIAPTVLPEVRGKQPFEIYRFCKNFVQELSGEKHPDVLERSYENGITDENMKTVLALVLHDELLKLVGSQG